MSRPPPIVRHPAYDVNLMPGHRFPMGKYAALARQLEALGLAPDGFVRPTPASREDLARTHDRTYVDAVLKAAAPSEIERRIGFPVTREVAARSAASAGGTLLAARLALEQGFAGNAAGGSHHAIHDSGAGFCVFNDAAVALNVLLDEGAISRAMVFDCDVHQGDGTALLFENDPRVVTASLHCEANFPARKQFSDFDLGLPRETGDGEYLEACESLLHRALDAGPFDLVVYNAGVDVHHKDELGYLSVTDAGLWARERLVLSTVRARGAPVVSVMGGGYSADVDALAARHAIVFQVAAELSAASTA